MEAGPQRGHLWLRASPLSPHVVLPPWHLLNKCGCPGLLHLTPRPPEAAWVTRHQARRLRDAGGGRGAERGPLWSGTGVLAGTGEGLAGARSAKAASRTVSISPPATGHPGSEAGQWLLISRATRKPPGIW